MRIAIVGSGISGLAAAYVLAAKHEIFLFEANDYCGGHSNTVSIDDEHTTHAIDTGFIVCNKKTYPNLINLFNLLDVKLQATSMSFSVSSNADNLEFAGKNLNTLFTQRKNIFNKDFWRMLLDISRFNKLARNALGANNDQTLGSFLQQHNINQQTIKFYIMPLIASIWSTSTNEALNFPCQFLFKFLENHGLLQLNGAPTWYSIPGGSRVYVEKILSRANIHVYKNTSVVSIKRNKDGVELKTKDLSQIFDKVVIATHGDQILNLLADPTAEESYYFKLIRYSDSEAILHTDASILPKHRRAWSAWNYKLDKQALSKPTVTYNMNILQNLNSNNTYCVSLNSAEYIDSNKILQRYNYAHPIYDSNITELQNGWHKVNNDKTFYCGAYWGYGFHEDGLVSALRVANMIDKDVLCNLPFTLDL